MPEIPAYRNYLQAHYPHIQSDVVLNPDARKRAQYDVLWRFMGLDFSGKERKGQYLVQDYNSLSTPPLAKLKNFIKTICNSTPDQRVFLNGLVQSEFGFRDAVPSYIRDMGVADCFYKAEGRQGVPTPDFDFVYAGKIDRGPEILAFMEHIIKKTDLTFYIIGEVGDEVRKHFQSRGRQIHFSGRVPYEEVPHHLKRGWYGLNLMPVRYPYSMQTATKVLEYCALGLPVVSNRYPWATQFEQEKKGRFYWIEPDFSNITRPLLEGYEYQVPDVRNCRWDSVIRQSGVFNFLQNV